MPQYDTDGDGVGNACDDCPNDPNKTSRGDCGCGQPETQGCGGPGSCTDGWQEYNGHCYKLTSVRTWDEAEGEALAAGGHLVAINDADENQWLLDTFGGENCWIGFHQLPGSSEPDGGWVWSSGAPVGYMNWCGGEPNDEAGEQWAEMKGTASYCAGGWNDQGRSTRTLRGIIELEP